MIEQKDLPEIITNGNIELTIVEYNDHTISYTVKVDGVKRTDMYFTARITGKSMEPLIPDGSLCLFKKYSGGSRQGKIMLVRASGITNPEYGGEFVLKRYNRKTQVSEAEARNHVEVHLISENSNFKPIILKNLQEEEISTPCEFVRVIK